LPFLRRPEFSELDKEKEYLLVDAKQKLLPQFTYTSPYSKYAAGSIKVDNYKKLLNTAKIDWDAEIVPKMIEASGLKEKAEGDISQYSGILQEEGMLFIGLEKLQPLQSVSLLFQFAEGSAENEDDDPPPIHWSYLVNNEWRPLKDEHIISDGTDGFRTTGIMRIDVPADASSHNTIMTDGLIWFCASVTKDSDRIPMLVDVVAQAVEVKFEDNGNAQSHFDTALSAGKISKLSVAVAEIGKISQPFASFDGKHTEIGKEFYTRVSERLRHKGRAITAWDYEHLILDRFPSIYKVKCITHTDPNCFCRSAAIYKIAEKQKEPEECTIEKVSLEFKEGSIELNAASTAALKTISLQMNENPDCGLLIAGSYTKDSEESRKLSQDRLEMILNTINTTRDRFKEKLLPEGENNIFIVEGITRPEIIDEVACCGPQVAPGHVLIIPIADLKNRNAVNPLQPKTSRRTLVDIEKYIKKRTSPFVKVHVRNPLYEQVLVYFKVRFYPGIDKGFYLKKLNEEIVHYLTPWAFDANEEVKFGQKIYASSVINFIEERPYVDFIVDFLMFVCRDECCPPLFEKKEVLYDQSIVVKADIKVLVRAGAAVQITGTLSDPHTAAPLKGITVEEKATDSKSVTDINGEFTVVLKEKGMVLLFTMPGYETVEVKAEADRIAKLIFKPLNESLVSNRYNESGMGQASLEKGCGCSEIEYILEKAPTFIGETVARPSTPRSILVSVPQHIIIPFEETTKPSPCDERKAKKELNAKTGMGGDKNIMIKKKVITKKVTRKERSRKNN